MYIYTYVYIYIYIERERGASVDGGGQAHRLALDLGREDLRDN